jgi:hypothetical protein
VRRAMAFPPISMDIVSGAIVPKVAVMGVEYELEKLREARALR